MGIFVCCLIVYGYYSDESSHSCAFKWAAQACFNGTLSARSWHCLLAQAWFNGGYVCLMALVLMRLELF